MLKERPFTFPLDKQIHVICDTDACNEAGDQYCITHMLMTPRFNVRALVAAHYGTARDMYSEQRSCEEIHRVVGLMGLGGEVTVLRGAPSCMKEPDVFIESEGARFIVEEATREDSRPLFICCIGAITNLTCAYLVNPGIAEKLAVIWIGGDAHPESRFEYNLHSDVLAANVVLQSELKLWQVPKSVYITMKVSFFELLNYVYPCGDIGRYLVGSTVRVAKHEAEMMKGTSTLLDGRYLTMSRAAIATSFAEELWSLGDPPVVDLMLNYTVGHFRVTNAPYGIRDDHTYDFSRPGNRKIHVYDDIGNHFTIKDFFEKMRFYFGGSDR